MFCPLICRWARRSRPHLAAVSDAAVSTGVPVSLEILCSVLLGIYPELGWLGHHCRVTFLKINFRCLLLSQTCSLKNQKREQPQSPLRGPGHWGDPLLGSPLFLIVSPASRICCLPASTLPEVALFLPVLFSLKLSKPSHVVPSTTCMPSPSPFWVPTPAVSSTWNVLAHHFMWPKCLLTELPITVTPSCYS